MDRDLTEAKIKLEQEEKLHLEKQNKLQDDLQKAKDQSEITIKQLQADMMKTETEAEKLRATISEMEKNRAEITTKFETLKREVWFWIIKWQALSIDSKMWKSKRNIIQILDFGCDCVYIFGRF